MLLLCAAARNTPQLTSAVPELSLRRRPARAAAASISQPAAVKTGIRYRSTTRLSTRLHRRVVGAGAFISARERAKGAQTDGAHRARAAADGRERFPGVSESRLARGSANACSHTERRAGAARTHRVWGARRVSPTRGVAVRAKCGLRRLGSWHACNRSSARDVRDATTARHAEKNADGALARGGTNRQRVRALAASHSPQRNHLTPCQPSLPRARARSARHTQQHAAAQRAGRERRRTPST